MAETYGFYDTEKLVDGTYDREYIAQQWADYFKLFIGTGVFASPTNQLKVVAGEGMNIVVKEGWAFIEGRWYHNDADLIIPVQPNTTASTITSGVFIQANSSDRIIKAMIATGRTTPDREAPYYELELAQIQLATGTTAITNSMITDMRPDESVCGFVKGLLEGVIPTADLFIQFEAQFNTWFQKVKDQLSEDAAGHLQNEIDALQPVRKRTITNLLDPSNYIINSALTTHGVTITNKGDGTFTVNGTTDGDVGTDGKIAVNITQWAANTKIATGYSKLKLCGTPASINKTGMLQLADLNTNSGNATTWATDKGDGFVFNTVDDKVTTFALRFEFLPNTTFDNVVFKPMLTADLNATYDDYVEYSGGGELNDNVAKHEKDITQLNADLNDKVSGFTSATYSAVTGLAYDRTNKKLGLKVNGADTVIPFSSGAVHLGRYSANETIDVTGLGATSVNQFLVTTAGGSASAFSNAGGSNITSSSGYQPATLSLSGNTLTVTAPTVSVYHQASGGAGGPSYGRCTYDVYFVGDIGEKQ